ncbi:MAG: DUF3416 domain-containing protein, partial [Micrococcales bacterium]|nr:DUF3416 domain-containing protein [Micrococcales bacterium]
MSTDPQPSPKRARRAWSPDAPIGRIPVVDVQPVAEAGRFPAKSTVGEVFPVRATVFREGHDMYGAEAVLLRPDGTEACRVRMHEVGIGLDHYEALVL